MFGYVRAIPAVLSEEEKTRYEGVYCGLCRTLGSRYGLLPRFLLNYDFVFLAMLLGEEGSGQALPCCPCPIHPWKKKHCWVGSPALDTAADESVILTWWKLQDSLRDGDWKERLVSRLACFALRRFYRKAVDRRPDFDQTAQSCLEELHRMEEENLPSLDRPADTFARILQAAATALEPPARNRAVSQILYHVGRWIYLADAWDDLEEDRRSGSYNPVLARFGEEAERQGDYLRETMRVSLGLADTAFSLLEWGEWEELLRHILKTGLPAVEEAVFTGQWKQRTLLGKPKKKGLDVPSGKAT